NPARVAQHAHGEKADVKVREADDDQTRPGPARVSRVQPVGPAPEAIAERLAVEAVEVAADEIAQRMAARGVAREQDDVRQHQHGPEPDPEAPAEIERE